MTNQTELTAERIKEAIGHITVRVSYDPENPVSKVYKTALAALRAEQERNKGCMYCVGFGISSATVKSDFGFSEKMKRINFCPYCGRRLPEGSAE